MKRRSKAVLFGRNQDFAPFQDNRYVTCERCGFTCHLDRDVKYNNEDKTGWGLKYNDDPDVTAEDVKDPIVTGGCPQCGTFLYNKGV
jgi:hypothetical protein